ncbi:hypothetical protein H310_15122 [Aphanomyces invadans]|uniref:Uncharacterized protein n=1 Tax=Aphanomyces invadans TaxID=157072 RepID=A0A024T819_9STRA|nr:hypothetical protein H310_15122 [Aphanomyces invadans]ETV90049.1 hypothetical protein H310_15122 [Aphanomyces invadans]|eukprot:XP_008881321.1 hypothetical protein H310_15122 [Aphanomyces invadans]
MEEVQFVDASDEAFVMGGLGEATYEYVCDVTSDVNVVDEVGMPARVFEANVCLAEFGRTHDVFERHVVWTLNAVATITLVAADGRGFTRYKDRMREGDPDVLEYITVFVYSLLRPKAGRQKNRRVGWPTTVGALAGSLANFALTRRSIYGRLSAELVARIAVRAGTRREREMNRLRRQAVVRPSSISTAPPVVRSSVVSTTTGVAPSISRTEVLGASPLPTGRTRNPPEDPLLAGRQESGRSIALDRDRGYGGMKAEPAAAAPRENLEERQAHIVAPSPPAEEQRPTEEDDREEG